MSDNGWAHEQVCHVGLAPKVNSLVVATVKALVSLGTVMHPDQCDQGMVRIAPTSYTPSQ